MKKYTFTFEKEHEPMFRRQLEKMEPEWYNIIEDIQPVEVDEKGKKFYSPMLQSKIEMDEMDALNYFRMPMGNDIKIRKERTEEELAEEKALIDKHKITVKVLVPDQNSQS